MRFEIDIDHHVGTFRLRFGLKTEARILGVVGPSGSGKTTLLNLIAGIRDLEQGRIGIAGRVLADTGRRLSVPAHHRGIGYVFQDGRLFPHLTVRQNLLYGRWFARAGMSGSGLDPTVELLGIAHLLGRAPGTLSGGEQQRVAIGRALLAAPRVLLMDEPLTSLDPQRREDLLPVIERIRDESDLPIVYVSHVRSEIDRLAEEVISLDQGVAAGPNGIVATASSSGPAGC